ncbi:MULTISPECIES: B3/B4 domain-containing protein [Dermacoccus]|uniref:B3/B4 domain-containing protein n=1 Tax=Dermacoccus TaxID=57495 RepID=UPI00104EEC27|nr:MULTISPECIES: phenylalanine--tRNA ligase beta subunit-related protein [Dermacoccus]TCJ91497.1 DNA/RNA-binding domain of Phe-tRNA-synthetase-like protein [Dermacoccus sp. SAI-028]
MTSFDAWLEAASIDDSVRELRPDYRAVLVVAQGLRGGESNEESETLLFAAEEHVRGMLEHTPPEELPHIAPWRDAYRAFGAKPLRTRNSAEALLRRADALPRVNALTDAYNAVSVRHQTPLGGEDLDAYDGPLRLTRATGDEEFSTMSTGAETTEHPDAGEVVWRDDAGVTCRRWNWRQCYRTRLTDETTNAIFICDVLDVEPGDGEQRATEVRDALCEALEAVSPGVTLTSRIL